MADALDLITTVVMTRNRRDELAATLSRHPSQVIVVDNASTDGSADMVERDFPAVELIRLARNAGAVARNIGVERARTPYVAFADDDSWWAPGSLQRAVEAFERYPDVAVVAATMLVGTAETVDGLTQTIAETAGPPAADGAGRPVLGFAACSAAVRRDAFLAAGGFDGVVFFPGEEERLTLDLVTAGWRLVYRDDIVVHHHPSSGRSSAHRRQRLVSRNHVLTAVMRRPWRVVAQRTVTGLGGGSAAALGVMAAVPRLPAAFARRSVVPSYVEQQARRLEGVTVRG